MRGNGLRAAAYIAVADLHPQVADVMLSALAERGVAAYASPVGGARGILMPTQFPSGPTDRLYVDRDAQESAWEVLDEHLPGARAEVEHVQVEAPPSQVAAESRDPGRHDRVDDHDPVDDEVWRNIVALFHGPDVEGRWPAAEDSGPPAPATEEAAHDAPARSTQTAPRTPVRDRDDHYHPPPAPPLPVADSTTRMAWAGVTGGPLLFLLALLLDWDLASWAQVAGVAALVIGFITLVARMRDTTDETDDGAVV